MMVRRVIIPHVIAAFPETILIDDDRRYVTAVRGVLHHLVGRYSLNVDFLDKFQRRDTLCI